MFMNNHHGILLLSGSSGARLAARICQQLELRPGRCFVEHFPDGEINVRIDEPVRGRDVFLIQSTCPPASENIFELLAFADACRRSAARSITAVIPYFGYGRSDKRHGKREPVLGSMIAVVMGVGAVFGALNTMYATVSERGREIATMRALGFESGLIIVVVAIVLDRMLRIRQE